MWMVLLPAAQAAPTFTRVEIYTDASASHEPVQVSMAFDDDGVNEHYFAFTRAETPLMAGFDHELFFAWDGGSSSLSTRLAGLDLPIAYYYPSLAVPPWSSLGNLLALRAGDTGGSSCDPEESILEEIRVNRSTGAQSGSNLDVDTVHACTPQHRDFLALYANGGSSTFEACWTVESSGQDDVYCDDRAWNAGAWQDTGSPGVTTIGADATDTENHSWPVVEANGNLRVAFHHNDVGSPDVHSVRVHRPSTPSTITADSGGFVNFPTMTRTTDVYHLAWHDITTDEIYHTRCGNDGGDDCEDASDWDTPIRISADGHLADGAQIVARANKVIVFYDNDADGALGNDPTQVWMSYSSDGGVSWCKQAVDGSQDGNGKQREEIGKGPYAAMPAVVLHEHPDNAGEYEVDVAYVQDDDAFGQMGDSTTHVTWSSADLDDFTCSPTCGSISCSTDEECDVAGCCDRDGCGTCSSGSCTAPP